MRVVSETAQQVTCAASPPGLCLPRPTPGLRAPLVPGTRPGSDRRKAELEVGPGLQAPESRAFPAPRQQLCCLLHNLPLP